MARSSHFSFGPNSIAIGDWGTSFFVVPSTRKTLAPGVSFVIVALPFVTLTPRAPKSTSLPGSTTIDLSIGS